MAQLTVGITLEWAEPGAGDAEPTIWKKIPDVNSIPTLIGAPGNHDVTTMYDTQKVYLEGLPDNGGTLAFGALFTLALFKTVNEIMASQTTSNPYFRVSLPDPLGKAYVWRGTVATPANDEWAPDNPIMGKLNVTPTSSIVLKDVTK